MGLFDGTPFERPVRCEICMQLLNDCTCPKAPQLAEPTAAQQKLQIRVEKRKYGKMVSVVSGFSCSEPRLKQLMKELKDHCGAGGSVDGHAISIQGDHVQRLRRYLREQGYKGLE